MFFIFLEKASSEMLGSVLGISTKSFFSDFCLVSEYSYENAFVNENQFLVNFQIKSFKIHNSQQMYFIIQYI